MYLLMQAQLEQLYPCLNTYMTSYGTNTRRGSVIEDTARIRTDSELTPFLTLFYSSDWNAWKLRANDSNAPSHPVPQLEMIKTIHQDLRSSLHYPSNC